MNYIFQSNEDYGPTNDDRKRLKLREYNRIYRFNNKLQYKEYNHKYHETNKQRCNEHNREYYQINKQSIKEYQRINKLDKQKRERNYRQSNKSYYTHRTRIRNGVLAQSQPLWANQVHLNLIYEKRDELNELWNVNFQVDHIVPLQGKTVCGLHCPDNLQLLDKPLNGAKGHHSWPDIP